MDSEPLAIVGVGCRLPGGVHDLEQARAVFTEGRDCIREIPPERWDVDAFYDADQLAPGKTYVRHGGFVDDVDRFDAAFFGIPDMEATHMDPQQRILLQTTWHALEHGAQNPQDLDGTNTGVFLALMATDYVFLKNQERGLEGVTAYESMSDTVSISAGRIAHFLGLEGPCVTVDTACSGSLVALHLARQSILTGECDSAVVAGCNAILVPNVHVAFAKLGLFSRGGRCRSFDAGADGYVRSEGCLAVLLRRLSLAEERGDPILATIVGTGVNHTGRSRTLTSPDRRSQERVIHDVLTRADVEPAAVGYIEAHGTGTPVGDPIEMAAIAGVFGGSRGDGRPLYVSSAKSNMGHVEAGAGLLGVVRAAMSLEHETIYPSLHLDRLNPKIRLDGTGIEIPTEPVRWPRGDRPRLAGVNSFGYSGTNAHALVCEAPRPVLEPCGASPRREDELLVLSAKDADSLDELAGRWADFLTDIDTEALPGAVCTAATGRAALRYRVAVTGRTGAELARSLRLWADRQAPASAAGGRVRGTAKVAFAFSGQGTQYPAMARELYATEPVFAAAINQCAELMDDEVDVPLCTLLFDAGPQMRDALQDTRYTQPALFAVEFALAELLRSWGVEPAAVLGHSIGELVAACVGGVLDLPDAARFAVARGRIMSALPREGSMLALATDEATVRGWLEGRTASVAVAAVNGPRSTVISGLTEEIDQVAALAEEAHVEAVWLQTSHAFHSPLMDPALAELRAQAATFTRGDPVLPVISTVTGELLTGDEGPEYWVRQAREAVRFLDAVRTAVDAGCTVVVEIGASPALASHIAGALGGAGVVTVPTLRRDHRDVRNMLAAAGALFAAGASLDLTALYPAPRYRRVQGTPQYPFRRDRYWAIDDKAPAVRREPQAAPAVPQPRRAVPSASRHQLDAVAPWTDHRMHGATVFPATAYLEFAVRAFGGGDVVPSTLTDVRFTRPLVLVRGQATGVTVDLDAPDDAGARAFTYSNDDGSYSSGVVAPAAPGRADPQPPEELRARMPVAVKPAELYGSLREDGVEHGFHFSTVRELWRCESGAGEALGRVTAAPDGAPGEGHGHRTATMLDGCLQIAAALVLGPGEDARHSGYVPAGMGRATLAGPLPDQVWSHVVLRPQDGGQAYFVDVRVLDDKGVLVADLEAVEFRFAGGAVDPAGEQRVGGGASRRELLDLLSPLPREGRRRAVARWLAAEVRDTLGRASEELELDSGEFDPSLALLEIGLDSLRVTELQRRLQHKLDFRFKAMQALDYLTIEDLADFLLDDVLAPHIQASRQGAVA